MDATSKQIVKSLKRIRKYLINLGDDFLVDNKEEKQKYFSKYVRECETYLNCEEEPQVIYLCNEILNLIGVKKWII